MDANRYFEQMHQVMSAQKRDFSLILSVKVQDLGGADAYIELRRNASGRARVFYSTMGRRNLNFQLFRKGWQLCHNASGEMTGRFPTNADALLDAADFSACIRSSKVLLSSRASSMCTKTGLSPISRMMAFMTLMVWATARRTTGLVISSISGAAAGSIRDFSLPLWPRKSYPAAVQAWS